MIAGANQCDFSCDSRSLQCFIRQQDSALLVPLESGRHGEVILVERQHVFIRRKFLLAKRYQMFVVFFGIKPGLAISANRQKKRVPISSHIKRLAYLSRDKHAILVINRKFMLAVENRVLHVNFFPLLPATWELLPQPPTISSSKFPNFKKKYHVYAASPPITCAS